MTKADAGSASEDTVTNRYRRSAEWMLAAFAAIGTVITASVTLGQLSSTDGVWWLMLIALAGYGLAMVGVFTAIIANAELIGPVTYSMADLRSDTEIYEKQNPDAFGTLGSAKEADDVKGRALSTLRTSTDPNDRASAEIDYAIASGALTRFLQTRALERLKTRYTSTMEHIKRGAMYTALGVGVFVGAVSFPTAHDRRESAVLKREDEVTQEKTALTTREAALTTREAAIKKKEEAATDVAQQATDAQTTALQNREAVVLKREQAVQARELSVNRAAALATPLLGYPVDGTWTPSMDSPKCKGLSSVQVRVFSITQTPSASDPKTLTPATTLLTLAPAACAGQLITVTSQMGRITIPLKDLVVTDTITRR